MKVYCTMMLVALITVATANVNMASAQGHSPTEVVTGFGKVFAVGDFNNDGFQDLAISAPHGEGRVFIYRGTSGGWLTFLQKLDQAEIGKNESGDGFGSALAAGDFNGDGYDDLAVGVPQEKMGNGPKSGLVYLFKGTRWDLEPWKGLSQAGLGSNEAGDRFGASLAAGDFNGDRLMDLAVGIPGEAPGNNAPVSGFVNLFKGTGNDLAPWKGLSQNGIGKNEAGDPFGASMVTGDFNGDGIDDLAVAVPGEAPGNDPRSGAVNLFKGTINGIQTWQGLDQRGLGSNESGDRFAASMAAGDFNGDGIDDLAVGAPGEKPGNEPQSGFVNVFKGTRGNMKPWQGLSQNGLGQNEFGDRFGEALVAGDFNQDGIDDLAVGAPGEKPGNEPKAGFAYVFKGSRRQGKLEPWHGLSQSGLGNNEHNDQFGAALAAGDFDADGYDDLVVGATLERPGNSPVRSGSAYGFIGRRTKLLPKKVINP